jgi:hypothetical protein
VLGYCNRLASRLLIADFARRIGEELMASKDAPSPCVNLPSCTSSARCPDGAFRLLPAPPPSVGPAATIRQIGRYTRGCELSISSPMRSKRWHGGQMVPITEQRV